MEAPVLQECTENLSPASALVNPIVMPDSSRAESTVDLMFM
jgi:hypothetical protein